MAELAVASLLNIVLPVRDVSGGVNTQQIWWHELKLINEITASTNTNIVIYLNFIVFSFRLKSNLYSADKHFQGRQNIY